MNKIKVLGMGPGHKDYITPKVLDEIDKAEIIVGAKRIFESIDAKDKEKIIIGIDLDDLVNTIKAKYKEKKVAILVSGDTGFYSMLRFLKKHFLIEELEVVPGISSMQYMFSKIGEPWDDAYIASVHGRDLDIVEKVKKYNKVGLLTDKKWSAQNIAQTLINAGVTSKKMYVGENLSYKEEKIVSGDLKDLSQKKDYKMCVVVIMDE
ncbi:precorrin-6y C5,15-methyltransferase (decarboxylating) subunit CbiE [Clostridium sp. D2Q-14]|uniref:precorrin-6y C5,15-methyltransferase (decarboxylating) subunit CbiE n=1 Tax=Anaeromonas gelatinilytica TaxID=2683194 RepID=UPI00193AFC83|nr:precorrin-6y C5,15-methyltransferase (decarboxylating) subunit CbiE [Anaeromonas gelatinilytica]MBS4535488.1 precorrin-6y C5,15-methyltransferase (decarboxylating) subunit CbiE [Anaeromonas gelatinilytica]